MKIDLSKSAKYDWECKASLESRVFFKLSRLNCKIKKKKLENPKTKWKMK